MTKLKNFGKRYGLDTLRTKSMIKMGLLRKGLKTSQIRLWLVQLYGKCLIRSLMSLNDHA